ncbi:MAG: hypothetical protein EXQ59_03540 [Acidobacteria bacterium]|nr:hypothetical protein [Acidobacteriota bacterium]
MAALLLAQPSVRAAGHAVTFRAANGSTVSGLMMDARDRPAPAVVLVPMLGRPKDDWQAVAQRLADANINALAIDLPGTTLPEDPAALLSWHESVLAAVAYLASRPTDVQPDAIGVAGASLGANLTLVAAAPDLRIRSIALVSPSLDYRGVRIEGLMAQYAARPAVLMASVHDPYAARSVRALVQDSSGIREVHWSSIPAHGSVMLSRDTDLARSLVEWFQRTLGVH